jgi:hypothetical protein
MKLSHLWVVSITLVISQASVALDICLHARKGHSFITVQNNGKVVKSLGLWPDRLLNETHPNPVAIDRGGDLPMSKAPDVSRCSTLKVSLDQLVKKALSYTSSSQYGPYKLAGNNCTHFAVRMYNYGASEDFFGKGDRLHALLSPAEVKSKIIKEDKENVDADAPVTR